MRHSHHHHRHGIHWRRRDLGEDACGMEARARRRRIFDAGELRLVLLKLIEEAPRHGYDLMRDIEARSGGAYAPSPGVVYPTLTLLLDMGFIEEAGEDGQRKRFAVTEAGRAHLAEREAEVAATLSTLTALAELRERTDAAPVVRAMRNLRAVLHNRLSQEEGADKSVVFEAARLIDEAAGRIERL